MPKILTELSEKFPKWILLVNNEIVKNKDGTIKEFKGIHEIEFYIDIHFEDGVSFEAYKHSGSFD